MIQPILVHSNQLNFSAAPTPDYADFIGNIATAWATTENEKSGTVAGAGTLGNFRFECIPAPGPGHSRQFTLMKNGVATLIDVTISGTSTSATYTATTVTIAPGDRVSIRHIASGTPAGPSVLKGSLDFEPTDGTSTIYGGNVGLISSSAGTARVDGPFFTSGGNNAVSALDDVINIVSQGGTIDAIYLTPSSAPGGTSGIDLYINLNGVRQDGSGGSTDTKTSCTGAATQGSKTGIGLAINAGDVVYTELVAAAGGSGLRQWSYGINYTPSDAGKCMIGTVNAAASTASGATRFNSPIDRDPAANASETDLQLVNSGLTPFGISDYWVWYSTDPGGATARTHTIRVGGTDTTLSATMNSGVFPKASDLTHIAVVPPETTISVKAFNTGSPVATEISWSMIIDAGETPVAVNDDDYETPCNTQLVVAAPGVLDNDIGFGLEAELVDDISPAGTLVFNSDGSFTFTPATNIDGVYTFTYKVVDAFYTESNTATVTITVGACTFPPEEPPAEPEVLATGLIEMCFGGRPAADQRKVGYRTFLRLRP